MSTNFGIIYYHNKTISIYLFLKAIVDMKGTQSRFNAIVDRFQ